MLAEAIKGVFPKKSKNDRKDLTEIDRERTEKALAEKPIVLPSGLTREQKREFILRHAK